jgi:WG containing repeat
VLRLAQVPELDEVTGTISAFQRAHFQKSSPRRGNPQLISASLTAVHICNKETGKWRYIDNHGKMVVKPQFDSASGFFDSMAAVRKPIGIVLGSFAVVARKLCRLSSGLD